MTDDPDAEDGRWRGAGDRIENLLDASSAQGGALARERAEALVREVADLYGAGLTRIVAKLDTAAIDALVTDDLVASLLLVHGLHPHDVRTRVETAIDTVRPYLGSHGGDVTVLDVVDGVVRLELSGSCRSCPSSSVTLELAVEEAVRAAAPEIESIEAVAAEPDQPGVIAVESLFSRVHTDDLHAGEASRGSWEPIPQVAELAPGEVGGFAVGGLVILVCRIGEGWYAYRDRCPGCDDSMAGAGLHSSPQGVAILRCPNCGARFDAVHAGARLDGDGHLEPLPMLTRDGLVSVAIPAGAAP